MKKNLSSSIIVFVLMLFIFSTDLFAQTTRYVIPGGKGLKDGTSWQNASDSLQLMINQSAPGDEVWAKGGNYKPKNRADNMSGANVNDRNNAFVLKEGVKVYGSFAGTETTLDQRDLSITANATNLTGDMGTVRFTGDNAYHLVISVNCTSATLLDGFTIKLGNASGTGSIIVGGKVINQNSGGGIYNNFSSPTFKNVIIIDNSTSGFGGGMYNYDHSSPTIQNSSIQTNTAVKGAGVYNEIAGNAVIANTFIRGNYALDNGGGISNFDSSNIECKNVLLSGNKANFGGAFFNGGSSPKLINCTVAGNYANNEGGAFFNTAGETNVTIRNTLIYGNGTAGSSPIMYNQFGGMVTMAYSLLDTTFWESTFGTDGGGNIYTNPLLNNPIPATAISTPTILGDYTTPGCSPAQNAGLNSYLSEDSTDLNGNPRIYDGSVDIGAYELQTTDKIFPTPLTLESKTVCLGSTLPAVSFVGGFICVTIDENHAQMVTAPPGAVFNGVLFASYGNPSGDCATGFSQGSCHADNSRSIVEGVALGNNSFSIAADNTLFGDPCSGTPKKLYLKLSYSIPEGNSLITYNWKNNNPSIGLSDSGVGEIPAFTATNPGTAQINVSRTYGACNESVLFEYIVLGNTVYVDSSQTISGDGSSWENAFATLSEALVAAIQHPCVSIIQVAQGTYYPTSGTDRDTTFLFRQQGGIKIYGGYPSGGGTRDITAFPTILSGDIGNRNDTSDNSYHVIVLAGIGSDADSTIIDGVTITNGNGSMEGNFIYNEESVSRNTGGGILLYNNSSTNIVVRNCSLVWNHSTQGGGIYNFASAPLIYNSFIQGNTALDNGGGVSIKLSEEPVFVNVLLSGNKAHYGGAMYSEISNPFLLNCTVVGNYAKNSTGGLINHTTGMYTPSAQVFNTIFYGNRDSSGVKNILQTGDAHSHISYSLIESEIGWQPEFGANDGYNLFINPQFIQAVIPDDINTPNIDGDYRLPRKSLVVNKGSRAFFNPGEKPDVSSIITDLYGGPRVHQDDEIDIGAYESPFSMIITPDANGVVYVNPGGSGNFSGTNWQNATDDIQKAINTNGVQQVWVAGGTYKPKYRLDDMSDLNPNDRDNSFVLKEGVKVYGGFAGTETSLSQRDLAIIFNASILSGNLGSLNDITDNSAHIVVSVSCTHATVLDGFTITEGYAYTTNRNIWINGKEVRSFFGGGLYNVESSPVLANLKIIANITEGRGGGMFNKSSSPYLSNVIIDGNDAKNGYGGGMYNDGSSPVLNEVTFSGNTTSFYGAGMYNKSSSPVLTNVTFTGNEAAYYGGGMYNDFSSPILTNAIISGNTTNSDGGGIYNSESNVILTNTTIAGNRVKGYGSGIFNFSSSNLKIRNSIIHGNSNDISYGNNGQIYNNSSELAISFSMVEGLTDNTNSNIDGSTDPLFEDANNGDYHLKTGSPVIGVGDTIYFGVGQIPDLHLITADLDGHQRIFGTNIDLGAYENQDDNVPVTLVNFTAKAENKTAKIQWTTSSETNNKEFIISRSVDGKTFVEIDRVAGSGNSNLQKDYVFYDNNPESGINYYRLQQVDFDGRMTEHGVRKLEFSVANRFVKMYPNPVKDLLKIEFTAGKYQQIELTDIAGRVLQRITLNATDNQKTINLSIQTSGIYFVRLVGEKVVVQKVVKN